MSEGPESLGGSFVHLRDLGGYWFSETCSADSVQTHFGTPAPVGLAVPQIHAFYDAAIAGQIDPAGVSAVRNAGTNRNLLLRPVSVADNHAVKIDRAPADPQLDGAEYSIRSPHLDAVMIGPAIHMGVPEESPPPSFRIQGRGNTENENEPSNRQYPVLLHLLSFVS